MSPTLALVLIKRYLLIINMMMRRALRLKKKKKSLPPYNIYLVQKFRSQLAASVIFGCLPVSGRANRGE